MRADVSACLAALLQIRAVFGTDGWKEAAAELIERHLDAAKSVEQPRAGREEPPTGGNVTEAVTTASCLQETLAPGKSDGTPGPAMQRDLFLAPVGTKYRRDIG